MAQQLSVQQFAKYMLFVKDILRKIEEKRGVTLTEYGASESRVSPSLSNELHSEPYQKQSGPVQAAKKSTSWDDDWGSINRLNATASNPTFNQTVTASQPTSVTNLHSQPPTPPVSRQMASIPPADVEWPPPNSSAFVSQSLANNNLTHNSNRLPDRTFDDIDPFANWPPRPNGSSINLSSNNNIIRSKPNHDSVVCINSYQTSMRTSAPMLIGKSANPDVGSIFASANSIGHTAPKLAPPPLTAVGRSRGRNQASLSSQAKPSSQESPILDLL